MKKNQIDILLKVLMALSALTTVIGAFLKITHHQDGLIIFLIGLVSTVFVTGYFEMRKRKASDSNLGGALKEHKTEL